MQQSKVLFQVEDEDSTIIAKVLPNCVEIIFNESHHIKLSRDLWEEFIEVYLIEGASVDYERGS